jgi:ribosomal protein S28E/S33
VSDAEVIDVIDVTVRSGEVILVAELLRVTVLPEKIVLCRLFDPTVVLPLILTAFTFTDRLAAVIVALDVTDSAGDAIFVTVLLTKVLVPDRTVV